MSDTSSFNQVLISTAAYSPVYIAKGFALYYASVHMSNIQYAYGLRVAFTLGLISAILLTGPYVLLSGSTGTLKNIVRLAVNLTGTIYCTIFYYSQTSFIDFIFRFESLKARILTLIVRWMIVFNAVCACTSIIIYVMFDENDFLEKVFDGFSAVNFAIDVVISSSMVLLAYLRFGLVGHYLQMLLFTGSFCSIFFYAIGKITSFTVAYSIPACRICANVLMMLYIPMSFFCISLILHIVKLQNSDQSSLQDFISESSCSSASNSIELDPHESPKHTNTLQVPEDSTSGVSNPNYSIPVTNVEYF